MELISKTANRMRAGLKPKKKVTLDPNLRRPPHLREILWTDQQKLFVKEWAAGNSVYSAAARAGYTDGGTYAYGVLIKNPDVIAVYEAEKAKYEKQADMSRQKVMDMLQDAFDMAKLMADPQAMVAAAREIGKMCGYYAPTKATIKIEGNVVLDKMNRLSDAELLELVSGANQQVEAAVAQIQHQAEVEDDNSEDSEEPQDA